MSTKTETICAYCHARNRVPIDTTGRPLCGRCQADLPWLADATAADYDAVIESSSMPVLVDLWAPWCGPCRAVAPALEELARRRAGSLRILKVNVDEEPGVSAKLGVQGIPTMVIFKDGREVARQVGALPAHSLTEWIDAAVNR